MFKFIRCHNCNNRLVLRDDALDYDDNIFCGKECLIEYVTDCAEEIEITEALLEEYE